MRTLQLQAVRPAKRRRAVKKPADSAAPQPTAAPSVETDVTGTIAVADPVAEKTADGDQKKVSKPRKPRAKKAVQPGTQLPDGAAQVPAEPTAQVPADPTAPPPKKTRQKRQRTLEVVPAPSTDAIVEAASASLPRAPPPVVIRPVLDSTEQHRAKAAYEAMLRTEQLDSAIEAPATDQNCHWAVPPFHVDVHNGKDKSRTD